MGDMVPCPHGSFIGYCDICSPGWKEEMQNFDLKIKNAELKARIAELEPKAAAFDAIVKHKLSVEYWDNGEWSTCTPLRAPNFYNADLLLAVQEVVGKIEGEK